MVAQSVCIRNSGNFGKTKKYLLGDDPAFDPEMFKLEAPVASPKLMELIKKIVSLDEQDKKKDGTLYKHMIFTDVESPASLKLIAGALLVNGFVPCFTGVGKGFHLKTEDELKEHKNRAFGVLVSKKWSDKTMNIRFKKGMLEIFNSRPSNVHGEQIRIMVLDNGYKEGIDLYDVKYAHLFDPMLPTDSQQAIGRSTRFCGQMGLKFKTGEGWPLQVYKYDMQINDKESAYHGEVIERMWIKSLNLDMRLLAFAADIDRLCILGAVDRELTTNMHTLIDDKNAPLSALQKRVAKEYASLKYPRSKIENMCANKDSPHTGDDKKPATLLTPTQQFVRDYFTPTCTLKGTLVYASVGSGKACTAVAVATHAFQRAGYTIAFVTRTTLKADIWKNISGKVMCHEILKEKIANGKAKMPKRARASMALAGKEWLPPMSYKQLTNMISGENRLYKELVERNGKSDPLRKTLLIIDEAHKLYSGTSKASEQPDVKELERWIHNSYAKSGKDSVRVMLMSGTPIVNDGMEMVKLLNLLRPATDVFPSSFSAFENRFLNPETGKFTSNGKAAFLKKIDGQICYINRTADVRYFAHPNFHEILVPMVPYDATPSKGIDNRIKEIKDIIADLKGDIKECKMRVHEEMSSSRIDRSEQLKKCMIHKPKDRKECKEAVREKFEARMEKLEEKLTACDKNANVAKMTEEADQLKEDMKYLRDELRNYRDDYIKWAAVLKAERAQLKEAKKSIYKARATISKKYKELPKTKENKEKAKAERAKLLTSPIAKAVVEKERKMRDAYKKTAKAKQSILRTQILMERKVVPDLSPHTRLHDKCMVKSAKELLIDIGSMSNSSRSSSPSSSRF